MNQLKDYWKTFWFQEGIDNYLCVAKVIGVIFLLVKFSNIIGWMCAAILIRKHWRGVLGFIVPNVGKIEGMNSWMQRCEDWLRRDDNGTALAISLVLLLVVLLAVYVSYRIISG